MILTNPTLYSRIFEHNSIKDLFNYINENESDILLIFDVDNTLIQPQGWVCGTAWFEHVVEQKIKAGIHPDIARDQLLDLCIDIQPHVTWILTEEAITDVIEKVQINGIRTIGLTSRPLLSANNTVSHLSKLNIHFKSFGLHHMLPITTSAHPYHYQDGIIFCGLYDKGKALTEILERIGYRPKKIIFIDDSARQVQSVANAVNSFDKAIDFIGIRYSHLDHNFKQFDPISAEQEYREVMLKVQALNPL